MDRQQVQDAAAELLDDVGQLAGQVAQLAGGRNDGEFFFIERPELGFEFFVAGGGQIFGRAEQACKRAINGVGGAGKIRMNTKSGVRAFGPVLPALGVEQIRLGFEKAGFGQGQFDLPEAAVSLHRYIAPGGAGVDRAAGVRGDDFTPEGGGAAEIGAEQRPPAVAPVAVAQREAHAVADKADQAPAGCRFHDGFCLRHFNAGPEGRLALRFRRPRRKAMLQVPGDLLPGARCCHSAVNWRADCCFEWVVVGKS